jgi:hypothetical protein
LVIKNTAGGAFTNEILKNYVSKEDAIDILSHGKISLSDYATISELQSYARKAHNHSNYALRGHNHDYRYADYAHTHAEYVTKAYLLQLVSTYLDKELSDADIVDLSENLVVEINELLAQRGFVKLNDIENIFTEAGFLKDGQGYYLGSDKMFINTENISDDLLKKLLYDGEDISNIETLNLTELTERVLDLFNRDSVQDTNVFIDKDIPVYADVGGIK